MIKFILGSDSGQLRVTNLCSRQISIWAYHGIMQIYLLHHKMIKKMPFQSRTILKYCINHCKSLFLHCIPKSSLLYNSAVEILKSFARHRSDRIRNFVRPNKILSDRTFFYKTYNFGHMMILGLNICMYCSKTNEQSDSSKIQCYYCSSVTCQVVVPAKGKHDGGMDGRMDRRWTK